MDPLYLKAAAPYAKDRIKFGTGDLAQVRGNRDEIMGQLDGRQSARVAVSSTGQATRFEPIGARPGTILYLHGGGWVYGSRVTHRAIMCDLAAASGMVVLGPDYPLAPENPYPAALEMLSALAIEVRRRAPDEPLILAGDSAGANLALGLAAWLAARGEPRVDALALFYGCYRRTFETDSHKTFGGGDFGLATEGMRTAWDLYLGAYPAPAFGDLSGLDVADFPPTFIGDAELDCLHDDGAWLAGKLASAGVDHRRTVTPNVPHGFLHYTGIYDPAFDLLDQAGAWLAEVCATKAGG